jgi:ADP-ribose pyrophosphatase YjhB (NUDIX family)
VELGATDRRARGEPVTRRDYLDDPSAPKANSLVPAASAIVVDDGGRILLHRRTDNEYWSIPGGAMEPGESIAETAVREVREETGIDVRVEKLLGVYSNPAHVVAYDDGEVRQQFSVCFLCTPTGGELTTSSETSETRFFELADIDGLSMHPSIRLRIEHYLEDQPEPVIA